MILVTGGAGYIGSHCVLSLLDKGHDVLIFDNLSTGHLETISVLKQYGNLEFVEDDLLRVESLKALFSNYKIDSVIHFAALSQIGESVKYPEKYYNNNVIGTLNLLNIMVENDVQKIVFSSTAAIYGEPQYVPIDEKHPLNPINPYGETKLEIEKVMDDYDNKYGLKSVRLRYFNVVGADSAGRIGEWHSPETHLVPNILKSTFDGGRIFELFGQDYDTQDGTCVRDYVNVEDLISAHLLALEYLNHGGKTDFFNIGTKVGNSVKEVFDLCENVTQKKIELVYKDRRVGDPAKLIADNEKARKILNWLHEKSLSDSIKTAYDWEAKLNRRFFDA